ncbi:MAG: YeeE/YedE thiosulfate transporter family protein [Thermodesulfobacteriota bacterium]
MLEKFHEKKWIQLPLASVIGFCFGFLLQRGGVTRYDIIMGQLLLYDWTVAKIILMAILTGMVGVYFMNSKGLARLHIKSGSVGATVIGGLIFGIGFGILGYCPGTMAGAAGQGSLDALFGGVIGMLLGTGAYARVYPYLSRSILKAGDFGELTIHGALKKGPWAVILFVAIGIVVLFLLLETIGV